MSQSLTSAAEPRRGPPARRSWRRAARRLAVALGVGLVSLFLFWGALHRYEWLGPWVAGALRAVLGTERVARLEDLAYGVEDRINRVIRSDQAPRAYWSVPSSTGAPKIALSTSAEAPSAPALPPFELEDPGPSLKEWSAPGDGKWVAITDPRRPAEPPYLYKTLLHPDGSRSWAEVFVVAVDLRRVDVRMLAGSREPKADNPEGEAFERVAKIPEADHEELLAAFNGGFMTEHGGYGMKLSGVVLVSPKPRACTFALYKDGSMRIATWKKIADTEKDMVWYRQAPECMLENNELHPGLKWGSGLKWGATLDGDTVIRRSAVGLSSDRKVLYVSITNHTTARVLADGMRHAGAVDIAQMDVNWSYPKFVLFEPGDAGPERLAVALAEGFEFSEDEYIRQKSRRDFFYLMRKPAPAQR